MKLLSQIVAALSIFAISNLAQAGILEIPFSDWSPETIEEQMVYNSSILDAFWAGDDGIECGEPDLEYLIVDHETMKIAFEVFPAALNQSCEVRSMSCEIAFDMDEEGTLLIPDEYVYLYGRGCEL